VVVRFDTKREATAMATIFKGDNVRLARVAMRALKHEQPVTMRQLLYRLVSGGFLPDTTRKSYNRLLRLLARMREAGDVPFAWVVDNIRDTHKPSSWAGLGDFLATVRKAYRKDFWHTLPAEVELFVEKDAIAGTVEPVTAELDVRLHVCRGYCSMSFAHEVAERWVGLGKPVHCLFLGDFDPSGFDLERDLREKLERYSERACTFDAGEAGEGTFVWARLAVVEEDFDAHDLLPLDVKPTDTRSKAFLEAHGGRCAEVDAIAPTELRRRVQEAIEGHIDPRAWKRLKRVEQGERESFSQVVAAWEANRV
jgi:hypothetical protein